MSNGYLALVLHAHLPYVRHPEYEEFLEEDWLFEAITETYLPLLQVLWRMVDEGVPFQLTMSLTPTLCSMLRDPLLQDRYVRYIERAIELAKSELERTRGDSRLQELARMYLERFITCRNLFVDGWRRDLITPFAQLQERGVLEIITCAATHGFLPLMANFPEAMRAQILIARDHYRETFGRDPVGIWLPECGYVPGLEDILQEANIRWFIMDAHGLMFGNPRPRYAIYAPVFTPSGVAAFARDRDSSRQVWSAQEGYPGDPAYRDFYRDIGMDLEMDYIRPFLPKDGVRKFTGIKYHRITGPDAGEGYLPPPLGHGRGGCARGEFHVEPPGADPASAREFEPGPDRGQPLRCRAFRPLVVRGAGVPESVHPQVRVRPARLPADHARPLPGGTPNAANGGAKRLELGPQGLLGGLAG